MRTHPRRAIAGIFQLLEERLALGEERMMTSTENRAPGETQKAANMRKRLLCRLQRTRKTNGQEARIGKGLIDPKQGVPRLMMLNMMKNNRDKTGSGTALMRVKMNITMPSVMYRTNTRR